MKGVLIVGKPESNEVKSLSVFLPLQKCSYLVYNKNNTLVPEHIGAMVFFEKPENLQELIDICQKYSINFISKFGFGGVKIPQTLNYSMRVMKEEQISSSFIFSLLNEMNVKSD